VLKIAGATLYVILAISAFQACALVDFTTMSVAIWPEGSGTILAAGSHLVVRTSEKPDRNDLSGIVSLSASGGKSIAFDGIWLDERSLELRPNTPLSPGVAYLLSIGGTVRSADGRRSVTANRASSFWWVRSGGGPFLCSLTPANGSSLSVDGSITYEFSLPFDPVVLKRCLVFSPACDFTISTSADKHRITIKPVSRWAPATSYSWSIDANCPALDGSVFAATVQGWFKTDQDTEGPKVNGVYAGTISAGLWSPTAPLPAEHTGTAVLGFQDALGIRLSEPPDETSIVASFSIHPQTAGRWSWNAVADKGFVVFEPASMWDQETVYTLNITTSLEDTAGNKLPEQFVQRFKPAIRPRNIDSVTIESCTFSSFNDNIEHPVVLDPDITSLAKATVKLPAPGLTVLADRELLIKAMRLEPVFPVSGSPILVSAFWTDQATLVLAWTGISSGTNDPDSMTTYQFSVSGGQTMRLSDGSYIPKTLNLNLRFTRVAP